MVFLPGELFNATKIRVGVALTLYASPALFPLDDRLENSSVVVGTPVVGVTVGVNTDTVSLNEPVLITLPISANKVCLNYKMVNN